MLARALIVLGILPKNRNPARVVATAALISRATEAALMAELVENGNGKRDQQKWNPVLRPIARQT